MSENTLSISNLNDFIFCPASIYFHNIDAAAEKITYQDIPQINGTAAHKAVDSKTYSGRKNMLQSVPVYSEKYNLYGKIDVFDAENGILTERKKKIINIYDGYVFQLYAQYFSLIEMGYNVKKIRLYSLDDNKSYYIPIPKNDKEMFDRFELLIKEINEFNIDNFVQDNKNKCNCCIYEPLCCYSTLRSNYDNNTGF